MKAFIVDRYGSKDGAPGEMPDPEFQKDETRQRAVSFSQIFNPQPNPQFLYPCATCAACGSPRVFVSCCKTNSRSAVTAEAAGSSPVVPAIFLNHLQGPAKTNLGPFGSNKNSTAGGKYIFGRPGTFENYWTRLGFLPDKIPPGKIASTNLSCAKRLVFDVA
jgi:hypothetical protein